MNSSDQQLPNSGIALKEAMDSFINSVVQHLSEQQMWYEQKLLSEMIHLIEC